MEKGDNVWLCNTRKMIDGKPQQVTCHMRHHLGKQPETIGTTEYSVVSDLTDES